MYLNAILLHVTEKTNIFAALFNTVSNYYCYYDNYYYRLDYYGLDRPFFGIYSGASSYADEWINYIFLALGLFSSAGIN